MKYWIILFTLFPILAWSHSFKTIDVIDEKWFPTKIYIDTNKDASKEARAATAAWNNFTHTPIIEKVLNNGHTPSFENGLSDFLGSFTDEENQKYYSISDYAKSCAKPQVGRGKVCFEFSNNSPFYYRGDVSLRKTFTDGAHSKEEMAVLVHEFGHLLGLDHVAKQTSKMNWKVKGDKDALELEKSNVELWPYDVAFIRHYFPSYIKNHIDDILIRNYYASNEEENTWLNVKHKNIRTGKKGTNITAEVGDPISFEFYEGSYSEKVEPYALKVFLKNETFEQEIYSIQRFMPVEFSGVRTVTSSVPNVSDGIYEIWIELDNQEDLNRANNIEKIGEITIGNSISEPNEAEFRIHEFYRSETPIYASTNNFFAEFTVENTGGLSGTIDDVAIAIIKSGNFIGDCWRKDSPTTVLSGNNYKTEGRFCNLEEAGTYSLEARLKVNGVWKTYNSMPTFSVIDTPTKTYDFFLADQELSKYTVVAGETIEASVRQNYVGNVADADMSSVDVGYYFSTNKYFDDSDVRLNKDSSGLGSDDLYDDERDPIEIPSDIAEGTYYILFVSDYDDEFTETDETNNMVAVAFKVTASSSAGDIFLSNANLENKTLAHGEDVQVEVRVNYSGNRPEDDLPSVRTSYYLVSSKYERYLDYDNSYIGSDDTYDNERETVTIPTDAPIGSAYIEIRTDDKNGQQAIAETNENNNVVRFPVTISESTSEDENDIYLGSTSIDDSSLYQGQRVKVITEVCYEGDANKSKLGSVKTAYWLIGNGIAEVLETDSSSIGTDDRCDGESEYITIPSNISTGSYSIAVSADYLHQKEDINLANNVKLLPVSVR